MRADNQGEGGILALTALLPRKGEASTWPLLVLLGIFGAALLYGDGMITPAITVLGAVEGLKLATPFFEPYVVPIAVAILVVVFGIQQHGTHRVGGLFGPIMVVWFVVIAALGVSWLIQAPMVLTAVDPRHAFAFFREHGWHGFAVLGAVFLVVTGGEALYADMGHFGKKPIRLAWFALVLPALLLNYFGQGALLLTQSEGRRTALLPDGARVGVAAARRPRDNGRHHRFSSPHLGCLFADPASHSARLLPPPGHRTHVIPRNRAGLRPPGQLGADGQHDRDRHRVRLLERTGGGLWHRRHTDDGHHGAVCSTSWRRNGGAGPARSRSPSPALFLSIDLAFFGANALEDLARRLAAAGDRRVSVHADDDLEDRTADCRRAPDRPRRAARTLHGPNRSDAGRLVYPAPPCS